LVIFGYIYRNLAQLRHNLAPIFGLGASGVFLVFFSGEVSDNGKPVPPPSRCLAAGRAIVAVKPRPCRSHPCHFSKISAIARLDRLRGLSHRTTSVPCAQYPIFRWGCQWLFCVSVGNEEEFNAKARRLKEDLPSTVFAAEIFAKPILPAGAMTANSNAEWVGSDADFGSCERTA
jgi:hypothetical protein